MRVTTSFAAGILLALLLTPATPAWAQSVRGRVVDDESGVPMGTVEVALLATDDSIVGRYVTDENGRFVARMPDVGSYRLRATRIGYEPSTSDAFALAPGQAALAELRLQLDPVRLDPLETVVEGQNLVLASVGFYRRQEIGSGQVRTPEDLEAKPPQDVTDLLRGMSGLRVVRPRGTFAIDVFSNRRAQGCRPSVSIDNRILQRGGGESTGWAENFNVREVAAIEVYAGQAGLPERVAGPVSPCGAILIWTKGYIGT